MEPIQLPKTRTEQLKWARYFQQFDPQVSTIIDLHAEATGIKSNEEFSKFFDEQSWELFQRAFQIVAKEQFMGLYSVRAPFNEPTWDDLQRAFREAAGENYEESKKANEQQLRLPQGPQG
jgi:hypothetical protein